MTREQNKKKDTHMHIRRTNKPDLKVGEKKMKALKQGSSFEIPIRNVNWNDTNV